MKIKQIESIINLMSKHDIKELSVSDDTGSVTIKKRYDQEEHSDKTIIKQNIDNKIQPKINENTQTTTKYTKENTIFSPVVGSFYRAPSPDREPFVKIGDNITPETTVCIIEAMKVMNEIKSKKHGKIKDILVENGRAVEFGQPLFILE